MILRRETHELLLRGYGKEIEREVRKLLYFEDAEVVFLWHEVLGAIERLRRERVVDLAQMRRLLLSLVAIERRIKERSGNGR
ncbi:MAG: hypothetical protein DRG69_03465 [Deltaproteobacteria bacterium]|nr:MAG: hypothetical protein DRG69_03465 [Deltaproteobacteria bacterium]